MSRKLFSISAVATLLGSSAIADVPNVSVDIAPLHSLVASVMNGVGVPNLIIPPGSSPHDHQLRPSEAKAMQDANIVFWMGEELTPWMENAVKTLSSNASVTTFLENDKTSLLEFREGALFEAHDHEEEHDDEMTSMMMKSMTMSMTSMMMKSMTSRAMDRMIHMHGFHQTMPRHGLMLSQLSFLHMTLKMQAYTLQTPLLRNLK